MKVAYSATYQTCSQALVCSKYSTHILYGTLLKFNLHVLYFRTEVPSTLSHHVHTLKLMCVCVFVHMSMYVAYSVCGFALWRVVLYVWVYMCASHCLFDEQKPSEKLSSLN